MRIGIIQRDDTQDVLSSSGTIYCMSKALERHVGEVVHLGPDVTLMSRMFLKRSQLFNTFIAPLFRRRLSPIHQRQLATRAARLFSSRIERAGCDVLYAPFASVEIAALATAVPIVYHTDMTWAQGVDYYSIYSALFSFARDQGEAIQRAALEKATVSIFPSAWAAKSATDHYGIDPDRISVIRYGANFSAEDVPPAAKALNHPLNAGVHLLWIGVDWNRKGGPVAYDCLLELLEQGVDAHLVVCGCTPPSMYTSDRMRVIPFLNKNDPGQRLALSQLFLDANFFLFPTLAETVAIVLCEASAHGLPSIARNTGGLASVVTEGVNGCLLPETATGKQFAQKIREVLADGDLYTDLVEGSRKMYDECLNWDSWGKAAQPLFEAAVRSSAA